MSLEETSQSNEVTSLKSDGQCPSDIVFYPFEQRIRKMNWKNGRAQTKTKQIEKWPKIDKNRT